MGVPTFSHNFSSPKLSIFDSDEFSGKKKSSLIKQTEKYHQVKKKCRSDLLLADVVHIKKPR